MSRKSREERRALRAKSRDKKETRKEEQMRHLVFKSSIMVSAGGVSAGLGRALRVSASEARDWEDFKQVLKQMMLVGFLGTLGYGLERLGIILIAYGSMTADEASNDPDTAKMMAKWNKSLEEATKEVESVAANYSAAVGPKVGVGAGAQPALPGGTTEPAR